MTELYIGGKLVDIDSDTKITLLYSSPFFVDIDKLLENRSYTISLPLTQNNQRVIELANRIDVKTTFPYRTYDALMIVDSVPIIEGGRAYLLTISDRIEIALTWGLNVGNLRDAMLSDYYDATDYLTIREFSTTIKPYFFPKINYGKEIEPTFPAVLVLNILDRLEISYVDVLQYIENFILCVTSKRGGLANYEQSKTEILYDGIGDDSLLVGEGSVFPFTYFKSPYISGSSYAYIISGYKGIVDAAINITITGDISALQLPIYIEVVMPYSTSGTMHEIGVLTPSLVTGTVAATGILSFEVNANDLIYIRIPGIDRSKVTSVSGSATFKINLDDDIENSGFVNFPIKENLPEIKAVDFLSAICTMIGASIVQDGDKLKIQRLNDILDKENYVDWSNKLISYSDLRFKFLDLAQRNYIEYQEESSRAYIEVSNSTLELTKTLADLPFLAVDDVGGVGYIPAYEYDEEKSEYEYSGALDPVILNYFVDGEGYISGRFEGLEATDIISDHYSTYKELVYQPKVITANIKLSIVDQLNLDFTRPIWMAQFGCFFALVEASISDGIGKCTLVRDTTISAYKFEDYLLSEDGQELTTESGEYLKY